MVARDTRHGLDVSIIDQIQKINDFDLCEVFDVRRYGRSKGLGAVLPLSLCSYKFRTPSLTDDSCFLAHPSCCFDVDFVTGCLRM